MSTFLELCQITAREVGIAGTGPVTTINQTGEMGDIVRWVADSYTEIQNRNGSHWRFLRKPFTLTTTSGDDTYAPSDAIDVDTGLAISRFSQWRVSVRTMPPTIFLVSAGSGTQTWMSYASWDAFKKTYRISVQVDSYPAHITVDNADNIVLGPQPNDIYTVTGEYWRSAQTLAVDADVPEMPAQFHKLIVWYAIENYGFLEMAPEVIARAKDKKRTFMRQLERNQLDRFGRAGPLA